MVIVFTIYRINLLFLRKLFAPENISHIVTREGFSDWRNTIVIDHHEKSTTHCSQTMCRVEATVGKQIQDECDYWKQVLEHFIAVICTLAESGLSFRGTEERFGPWQNGEFKGFLSSEVSLIPFSRSHFKI